MHKITNDELKILIAENSAESMHVDFKQEWHSNNAKLILDILCLSNVDYWQKGTLPFNCLHQPIRTSANKSGWRSSTFRSLTKARGGLVLPVS